MEIQVDCEQKGEVYNIDKIAKEMEEAKDITIEWFYNKETGKIRDGIEKGTTKLEGIVVSVDEYSEYKFLIGEKGEIEGVLEGEVTDTTSKEDFINLEEFETKAFSSTATTTDNIEYSYEKKRIESNKMQLIITIKDNENGLNKVKYPNGDILKCEGKNQVGIDYTIECGIEYKFEVTSNNGYIKEITIYEEKNEVEYLYNKGNQYEGITGGWNYYVNSEYKTTTLENKSYSSTYGEYGITTDNLGISVIPVTHGKTGSYVEFKTSNKIDLTSYDRIGILGVTENMTDYQLIGITNNTEYNWIPSITNDNKVTIKNNEITYLDISSLEGEYYIQFGMGSYLDGKGKIKEIWLESDKKEILDLYNRGNENTQIGGAWIENPLFTGENNGVLKKEKDYMLMEVNAISAINPFCSKTDLLNIAEYDRLRAEVEAVSTVGNHYRNINIDIFDNSGNHIKQQRICAPAWGLDDSIGKNKIGTLNLIDITDKQVYLGISANGYTFKIHRIWLEKIIK